MASLRGLGATAKQILAAFETQLTAQGVELPENRYVVAGSQLVLDGEQLNVLLIKIVRGQPGAPIQTTINPYGLVFAATFAVVLARVVPVISGEGTIEAMLPEIEELNSSGETIIDDAEALARAAEAIHLASLEHDNPIAITGPGEGFAVEEIGPMSVSGGLVVTRCVLTLSLS